MKKLVWTLILPLTIISMTMYTKWWYAVIFDGPDDILIGFPFPFVCDGWHTSLSLQIFIVEFIVDFMIYFFLIFITIYLINRFIIKIILPKIVNILLIVLSSLTLIFNVLIASNPDNIFYFKRGFDMEVMETGFKFIWQKQVQPDFYKYHPEYRND